jgi:hypothetical protein
MPIYPANNTKLVVLNEKKTSGVIVEYPNEMGVGEVLDRINELRASLMKSLEDQANTEIKKDDQVKDQDIKRE